jgi:hypothetical protein
MFSDLYFKVVGEVYQADEIHVQFVLFQDLWLNFDPFPFFLIHSLPDGIVLFLKGVMVIVLRYLFHQRDSRRYFLGVFLRVGGFLGFALDRRKASDGFTIGFVVGVDILNRMRGTDLVGSLGKRGPLPYMDSDSF